MKVAIFFILSFISLFPQNLESLIFALSHYARPFFSKFISLSLCFQTWRSLMQFSVSFFSFFFGSEDMNPYFLPISLKCGPSVLPSLRDGFNSKNKATSFRFPKS